MWRVDISRDGTLSGHLVLKQAYFSLHLLI
jgi:hypothetical protein